MALGWKRGYLRYRSYFLDIINLYKKRQDIKMFLEILLTLTTISFFTVFALRPTLVTIIALVKEIKAKEETVAKMDTKIQNLREAQAIFTKEQARINLLNEAVPDQPSPETFIRQIEGLAAKHAVNILGATIGEVTLLGPEKLRKSSFEEEALPEGAGSLSFSLSVTGNYQALVNFLTELEALRRPIKIDSTNISSSTNQDGQEQIIFVITGRAPYLRRD